ncbi:PRD domain-containing protein [Paenibacillus sp. D2_2]|uniref:PRD domain-containing protein n=1 Tax=Paenibacillus sp. D2_2 TaxID=3073092 RepID=UPI002815DB6D|nr:PRD domain-containing protein [Paenibacillus sp. D2_2]WMT42276.1 PRD domain-containing protein [Paenibacillus sp. D2_2]
MAKPAATPVEIDVKHAYQWIFYAARSATKVVEELFDLSVPDSEVAHLSLYIGAAVERKKEALPPVGFGPSSCAGAGSAPHKCLKFV